MDHKSKGFGGGTGGYRGRIIFLGDGSEVLTDSGDTEMFDQEDKDLDSQVSKTSSSDGDTDASASSSGPASKADEPAAKTDGEASGTSSKPEEPSTKTSSEAAKDAKPESKTDA